MAAVVNGTAALGLVVYSAEKLPLGGAHFGAGDRRAWRGVEEKAYDQAIALGDEEAAELIEPEGAVDTRRGGRQESSGGAVDRSSVGGRVVVVEGGEMLLELKG